MEIKYDCKSLKDKLCPTFEHITQKYKNLVYEPSEDTFLLIDTLVLDKLKIILQNPKLILEIG